MDKTGKNTLKYGIGAVAAMIGVSVETIRLYERRGLVLSTKNSGNQREYSDSDVDRLRCIRTAITEHKISIEGIRKMQSMIPCWEYSGCSQEDRSVCPAYTTPEAGCWTYKHLDNACSGRICRECEVYRLSADCHAIKAMIHHQELHAAILTVKETDQ